MNRFLFLFAPVVLALGTISIAPVGSGAEIPSGDSNAGNGDAVVGDSSEIHLRLLGRTTVEGAEVVSLDPTRARAYVSSGRSVVSIDLRDPSAPQKAGSVDVVGALGFLDEGMGEVTHVEVDPVGRGFVAACVVIADRGETPGVIAFLDAEDLHLLSVVDVGFTPDACAFTPEGDRVFIANEGEATALGDPPGSISWISLDGVAGADGIAELRRADANTTYLCGPLLSAVSTGSRGLRIHPKAQAVALDLEPEYLTITSGRVYATLQENNGVAVLDASDGRLLDIRALPAVLRRIDANDTDRSAGLSAKVLSLPMPDQIASFGMPGSGRKYLVTANEGDDRGNEEDPLAGPFADRARVATLASQNRLPSELAVSTLSRLLVSTIDGDQDGDGVIETPTLGGDRAVTVWDAETLERVGDSGSQLEEWAARVMPDFFNASVLGDQILVDDRSDDRGPEPEGVCTAIVGGVPYAFASLERPGAVAVVRLSDPSRPEVVHLEPLANGGDLGPEGLRVLDASLSPIARPLLVVACEASSSVLTFEIARPK